MGDCVVLKHEDPLSPAEAQRLEDYEAVISAKLKAFYDVGKALAEIRDSKLYREQYSTFEEYCRDRWDMSKVHAYRLLESSMVYENVKSNQLVTPTNESQARPLAKLAPQLQIEAWQKAVETAPGGKVTAKHVKSIADGMIERGFEKEFSQKVIWHEIEAAFNNLIRYIKKNAQTSPLPDDFDFSNIRFSMKTLSVYLEEVLND